MKIGNYIFQFKIIIKKNVEHIKNPTQKKKLFK